MLLTLSGVGVAAPPPAANGGGAPLWEQSGWGGGGYYWAAAFHPTQDGVIYMAGDVLGVYKTTDHGLHWRIINRGLTDYGVYSLAVDRTNPQTVYAATEGGLYKSTNAGESWARLPHTGRGELRLTGERGLSTRCIAVDPVDGRIVYAGSPAGQVYKSTDGGQTWAVAYRPAGENAPPGTLRVQFGGVGGDYFGGVWLPLTVPAGLSSQNVAGFGFAFAGDGTRPQQTYLWLQTASGARYRSKSLTDLFADKTLRDVLLRAGDFALDPDWAKQHADAAKKLSPTPDGATLSRMDVSCAGPLPTSPSVARLGRLFFAVASAPNGKTPSVAQTPTWTIREFSADKAVQTYGNIRVGEPQPGSIASVAVAPKAPATVLAVSQDAGLLLSRDAGKNWNILRTPARASAAAFDPADPRILYAGLGDLGIGKSTDGGATWTTSVTGLAKNLNFRELAVSVANPQDVYAIGGAGWGGAFYVSHDGGKSWTNSSVLTTDHKADPTLPGEGDTSPLSAVTNLALNPADPQELFISGN